jgi:hypothetical protein
MRERGRARTTSGAAHCRVSREALARQRSTARSQAGGSNTRSWDTWLPLLVLSEHVAVAGEKRRIHVEARV